jgi:hypothetical protein
MRHVIPLFCCVECSNERLFDSKPYIKNIILAIFKFMHIYSLINEYKDDIFEYQANFGLIGSLGGG